VRFRKKWIRVIRELIFKMMKLKVRKISCDVIMLDFNECDNLLEHIG